MPRLRAHVGSAASLAVWQRLQATPDYALTHRAAAAVLAKAKTLGAFSWLSKQAGSGAAYVFYCPPQGARTFEVLREHPLDGAKGWRWIDRALTQADIRRLPTDSRTLKRLT